MLTQAKASPDITNYLTYILCKSPSVGLSEEHLLLARSSAAVNLKNVVISKYKALSAEKQAYIRSSVLLSVRDPKLQIRNLVGNIITEIVRHGGVMGWPEVYSELFSLAGNLKGSSSPQEQEGAMSALAKICEDNKKALDRDYSGQRPLDSFLPRLYDLTTSQEPKIRALALECINIFIPHKSKAILSSIDTLKRHLFQLANDTSEDVRRYVCRSFVQLVFIKPETVLPHMGDLVDYMISQQRSTNESEVSLEAAEFWLAVGESEALHASLLPFLGKIVPSLLEHMVYSEEDIARLEGERDDAEEDDREQDLKPQFAKPKRVLNSSQSTANGSNGTGAGAGPRAEGDTLSEGEVEDREDEGEEDPEDEWNLRKCSAAALDNLAGVHPAQVFEISLPYLKTNLQHTNWPNREAAVLAFGAVAQGCQDVILPYVPELVPFFLTLLQDSEPVVRKITCWTLGRYTELVVKIRDEAQSAHYLEMIIDGILKKMVDRNKSVQEGAASAFSTLEDTAKSRLTKYCKPIVQQFVRCFDLYKDRNMFILYDCVQTLAEHVGPALAHPELQSILMPALIHRWEKIPDESRELFPLLECLAYVAIAMRDYFSPYAVPIFRRCIRIIHQHLKQNIVAASNEHLDRPDKDFLITSLDLLSSIIQALPKPKSEELVQSTEPKMLDLLHYCMQDSENDVRQSSYALLGDCAIEIFPLLQPALPNMLPVLIRQLDIASMPDEEAEAAFAVINNACWSCGEIARQEKKGMQPHVGSLYGYLFTIITSPGVPVSVTENAAIALGRLGTYYFESLAPRLAEFAKPFLQSLERVEANNEKGQAFLGFNRTISLNPSAMGDCLVEYLQAAAELLGSKCYEDDLRQSLQQVRPPFSLLFFACVANLLRSCLATRAFFLTLMPLSGNFRQRSRRIYALPSICDESSNFSPRSALRPLKAT